SGKLLVVGWGSTYRATTAATRELSRRGASVAHLHLRHLTPLPRDLGEILARYARVVVPALNLGRRRSIRRDKFLVDARGINSAQGEPCQGGELVARPEEHLS